MAIEAVIWDFGGVFTSSPFEAFARYEAEHALPKDLIRKINSTNPDTNAWALFERNEIDTQGFDALFLAESTALGHPVPGADVLPAGDKGRFAVTSTASDEYVFRAAPLRNIALTAPYFHSGKVWDLKVAVEIMAESQLGEALKEEETAQLLAFLDSLTGTLPEILIVP